MNHPKDSGKDQQAIWSARYQGAGADYLFGVNPNRFLERHAELLTQGSTALCVADGEGRNSVWLAEQGLEVTALEITSVAIEKAHKLAGGRGVVVNFEIGNMMAPDWPPRHQQNAFDWVVGIFIQFVGAQDRIRQMDGLKRATRPGGRILLQGYTPRQHLYRTGGPSDVENLYTPEILRELFADWIIEELVEYDDDITEGSGHAGRSALIGLITRKPESVRTSGS